MGVAIPSRCAKSFGDRIRCKHRMFWPVKHKLHVEAARYPIFDLYPTVMSTLSQVLLIPVF